MIVKGPFPIPDAERWDGMDEEVRNCYHIHFSESGGDELLLLIVNYTDSGTVNLAETRVLHSMYAPKPGQDMLLEDVMYFIEGLYRHRWLAKPLEERLRIQKIARLLDLFDEQFSTDEILCDRAIRLPDWDRGSDRKVG